ncbi:MAG: class I SAM-dependent rRNA methyltransferase [Polyangiaceae bacterium]|nr:class I SAM-dependent rRNA methyltransferase [Polyangiaceae bacterium]
MRLKPGHVQPVWAGHPWIYAQAVDRIEGAPAAGDEVDVFDPRGQHLGRGLYSPGSAIAVRLFTRQQESLNASLLTKRVSAAAQLRRQLGFPNADTTAFRLIHAEGDQLPGLIVDRFGDALVVQFGTRGMQRLRDSISASLQEVTGCSVIIDRTSVRTAKAEGFEVGPAFIAGQTDSLRFRERGLDFELPTELTQKTGYYLDQRPLRDVIERLAASNVQSGGGGRVLDGYCFVGSAALAATRGGAKQVHAVDSSAPALEVGERLAEQNGLSGIRFQKEDMRRYLEQAEPESFDLVICDPPKLAPNRSAKNKALDAMRKLAQGATRACTEGGIVILCSCSAAIGLFELRRAMALGARDAGRRAVVLERVFQGGDHPVPAAFPEGQYLTNLVVQVSGY